MEKPRFEARADIVLDSFGGGMSYRLIPIMGQTYEEAKVMAEVIAFALNIMKDARSAIVNTPETRDFMAGVPIEATHQRERWGSDHDEGKGPFDWFWLIGYLAQKAAASAVAGDLDKAKHHTISTAAALANWHAALAGIDNSMRPGIEQTQ